MGSYPVFKSVEEAVKQLGKEEALKCLNTGVRDRMYRKSRNEQEREIIKRLKADPKFMEQLAAKSK